MYNNNVQEHKKKMIFFCIVQRGAEEICDGVGGQMCQAALFC